MVNILRGVGPVFSTRNSGVRGRAMSRVPQHGVVTPPHEGTPGCLRTGIQDPSRLVLGQKYDLAPTHMILSALGLASKRGGETLKQEVLKPLNFC